MADIKSFPNNQNEEVGAENVMKWHHGRTSGVFGAQNNAAVSAVQGEMAVNVSDGYGWLSNENADGVVWWNDKEKTTGEKLRVDVSSADGVFDRIDRVVVSWETTNYVSLPTITILQGTPSGNPVAPYLTNDGTMRQISLAKIYVSAGTLALTNAMITDERLDHKVCGIVTESANVDTSMISEQASAVLKSIQDELARLEAGTAVEMKKLLFRNVSVQPSSFYVSNEYSEFPYRVSVPLSGAIESMIPDVTFSIADAIGGNYAPVAKSYNGGIYLYAASAPGESLTIPTVILWRGDA